MRFEKASTHWGYSNKIWRIAYTLNCNIYTSPPWFRLIEINQSIPIKEQEIYPISARWAFKIQNKIKYNLKFAAFLMFAHNTKIKVARLRTGDEIPKCFDIDRSF